MTNIDKIREAREAFNLAYDEIHNRTWKQRLQSRITVTALHESALRVMSLQAQAIVQATEVADENFERAQKLSDQVQENIKHIEALAGRRGEEFCLLADTLEDIAYMLSCFTDREAQVTSEAAIACIEKARAALDLAKGEVA